MHLECLTPKVRKFSSFFSWQRTEKSAQNVMFAVIFALVPSQVVYPIVIHVSILYFSAIA